MGKCSTSIAQHRRWSTTPATGSIRLIWPITMAVRRLLLAWRIRRCAKLARHRTILTKWCPAAGEMDADTVRSRIYLRKEEDWEAVFQVHARCFAAVRPANTLIAGITMIGPYDVEIEVEAEV